MINEEIVKAALAKVKYPGYSRDIMSFGLVKEVAAANGAVSVRLELTSASNEVMQKLKTEIEAVLKGLPEVARVHVDVVVPVAKPGAGGGQSIWSNQNKLSGIKRVIAVASGKGGVGKSTAAVNLSCALRKLGLEVGLLDCDIYGPSIPLMMGINERPTATEDKLFPLLKHGVKLMSIGFLLEGDAPVIWRGPMIVKTIQQFLLSVVWGQLDCLLVDLPPGTGDAQLSLCQTVPLDGGVIVTTPQEASLGVVRRGIAMFEKVNVPILGIIENMSYYTTPQGERVEIFGHGGGRSEAERQKVSFLGEIPLFTEIREGGDKGIPVVIGNPKSVPAQTFMDVASLLGQKLGLIE